MALRKPLVIVTGQIEQLQAGDTLDAVTADGQVVNLVNGEAGAITICQPVYASAADTVKKAQANSLATASVLGLVFAVTIASGGTGGVIVGGPMTATTAQWDTVLSTVGGLTPGVEYYLDPATSAKLVPKSSAPTTVGQVVTYVGKAYSTTEMQVNPSSTILL
jgi:hypothetical protein